MMKISEARNDPQGFWNKRARTFPRYSADEKSYEAGMLSLARKHGVSFQSKRILDVGSGSGMYTIRLALEADKVTALDISREMLGVLRTDAEAMGLANIEYVNTGWLNYRTDKKFDLIFCSMTPALSDEAGRDKLLTFETEKVVYMGWNGGMKSEVMAGLYDRYAVVPAVFNDASGMRTWLERRGIAYETTPVSGQWLVPYTKDDLAYACRNTLNNYGVEPEPAFLDQYLERFRQPDGLYLEATEYSIEMIIW